MNTIKLLKKSYRDQKQFQSLNLKKKLLLYNLQHLLRNNKATLYDVWDEDDLLHTDINSALALCVQKFFLLHKHKNSRLGKSSPKFLCKITGRPRGVVSKFFISRHLFKNLAHSGELPGIKRTSW